MNPHTDAAPHVAPAGPTPVTEVGDRPQGLLSVTALWDPDLATTGFDPLGPYVERFWLPIIGPTSLLALRWTNQRLREHPGGFTVAPAELARCLGVGIGRGDNSPAPRALARLCHFGLGRSRPGGLAVRTHLPPVGAHQLRRLPRALREDHPGWLHRRGATGPPAPAA